MADRYWVGTGTWNNSLRTNWSATSGGATGATVPTSIDRVFFNASSGGATIAAGVGCLSIDTTGHSGQITIQTTNSLSLGNSFDGLSSTCVFASGTVIVAASSSASISFGGNYGGNTLSWNPQIAGGSLFSVRFAGNNINTAWTINSWGTAFGFPGISTNGVGAFVHQFCNLTLNANVFAVSYNANNGSTTNRTRLNFNGFSIFLGRNSPTTTSQILFSSLTTVGMRQMVGNGGFVFDGTLSTTQQRTVQWNSFDSVPNFTVSPASSISTPINAIGSTYFDTLTFNSTYAGTLTTTLTGTFYARATTLSSNAVYTDSSCRMGMFCNNNQAGDMTFTSNGRQVRQINTAANSRTTGTIVYRFLDAVNTLSDLFITNTTLNSQVIFSNSFTGAVGLGSNSSSTTTWTFSASNPVSLSGNFTISNGTQIVATNPSVWNFSSAGTTVGFNLGNNTYDIGNVTHNGGGGQIQFNISKTYPTFTLNVASLTMNTPTGVGGNPTINIPNNVGIAFGSITLNTSSTRTITFGGGGIGPKYITSPISLNVTNCSLQGINIVGGRWNAYNSNNNVDLGYNVNVIFPNPYTTFGPFFNLP